MVEFGAAWAKALAEAFEAFRLPRAEAGAKDEVVVVGVVSVVVAGSTTATVCTLALVTLAGAVAVAIGRDFALSAALADFVDLLLRGSFEVEAAGVPNIEPKTLLRALGEGLLAALVSLLAG